MVRSVVGNYASVAEAEAAVRDLINSGYPKDAITLIVNKNIVPALKWDHEDVHVENDLLMRDGETEESLWDRVKNFFGSEVDDVDYDKNIEAYQADLNNGNVLVVVDEDYGYAKDEVVAQPRKRVVNKYVDKNVDNDTLRLLEERLHVSKDRVQTGEAVIGKHVVEETKTIEVPVTREELVIERRPVKDGEVVHDASFDGKEIKIPLTEEQVHVSKDAVVTEEINVKKRDVHDTKVVADTVRKEELDVDNTGSAVIRKDDNKRV